MGHTRYCMIIQENTVVAYTSLTFHGLVSGSNTLISNRGRGIGWKFFRPAAVIAGFLVLLKRGFILFLRIYSIMNQSERSFSNLLSVMYAWSIVVDFAKLSLVTQASFSEVKHANATIMSGALNALCIGKRPVRHERTDTARVNLNRLSLIISIFSDVESVISTRLRAYTYLTNSLAPQIKTMEEQ